MFNLPSTYITDIGIQTSSAMKSTVHDALEWSPKSSMKQTRGLLSELTVGHILWPMTHVTYQSVDPWPAWPVTHDYSPVTVTVWRLPTLGTGKEISMQFRFHTVPTPAP